MTARGSPLPDSGVADVRRDLACGNVNEWCRDWARKELPGGIDPDLHDELGDPNDTGNYSRARRGGCYADPGWVCRSAVRQRFEPERRHEHIGLRIAAVRP